MGSVWGRIPGPAPLLLVAAGFIGLSYGSLAAAPITLLADIHRVTGADQLLSFPAFTTWGHFIAYALCGLLLAFVNPGRWRWLGYIGLTAVAIGLEVAQQDLATRSFDWADMLAGVAGVVAAAATALLLAAAAQVSGEKPPT